MRAAHVVGVDLELRHAVGSRFVGEQQRAVFLVRIGFLRVQLDFDQAREHAPSLIRQHALEQQIAVRSRLQVMLERQMVEMLILVREVNRQQLRRRARVHRGLDFNAGKRRAHCHVQTVERRVGIQIAFNALDVREPAPPVLNRYVTQLRSAPENQLDRAEIRRFDVGAILLIDVRDLRVVLEDNQCARRRERALLIQVPESTQRQLEFHAFWHV